MHNLVSEEMMLFKVVLLCAAVNVNYCQNRDPCDLYDVECVTKATAKVYPDIVAGIHGVKTSDPITKYVINVNVPRLSYNLYNATMTGLKDCKVIFVKFNLEDESVKYGLLVPKLVIKGDYIVNGFINNTPLNGKGKWKSTYSDFVIIFDNKYIKIMKGMGKIYHKFTNFTLEMDVKGKTKYECTGHMFHGENAILEKNIQGLDELIRRPLVYSFMREHVDNKNNFLKIVPITDVIVKL